MFMEERPVEMDAKIKAALLALKKPAKLRIRKSQHLQALKEIIEDYSSDTLSLQKCSGFHPKISFAFLLEYKV
jgi:glutamate 5-kinase